MQKDEIITIRTNSQVKKMVEDARNNSGQTAGDWLQQAVFAWQEKHAEIAGEVEIVDSAHIIAGRKALSEIGKILESLELVVKQTAESSKQDNIDWQNRYNRLEEELSGKDEEIKVLKDAGKAMEKEHKSAIGNLEKIIDKQAKDISELEANKESIKEVTRLLEQERMAALKVYNAREDLLKVHSEMQDNYKQLQLDHGQQTANMSNLNATIVELHKTQKELTERELQKDREIMQLTLAKNYADSSIAQLQESVQSISAQLDKLKAENMALITQKSELIGELNAWKRSAKE